MIRNQSTHRPAGFTMLEVLMATTLTLVVMGAVVTTFGLIATSINELRSTMTMSEQLRATGMRLQQDLAGVTAVGPPPFAPEMGLGYFEIYEGPIGPVTQPGTTGVNSLDNVSTPDSTVGDNDDILMFTARNSVTSFHGMLNGTVVQSPEAEIAWFVRGRTLYRRVLLICPQATLSSTSPAGFYESNDISVHLDATGNTLVPNSLGDLARREYRFAHPIDKFPFDVSRWGQYGLPTLDDCSFNGKVRWSAVRQGVPASTAPLSTRDYWHTDPSRCDPAILAPIPSGRPALNSPPGSGVVFGSRQGEDVILNNVIGFDVKVYDPGAPIYEIQVGTSGSINKPYVAMSPGDRGFQVPTSGKPIGYGAFVDLGWGVNVKYPPTGTGLPLNAPSPRYRTTGNSVRSPASGATQLVRTYDTYSMHYARGGTYGSATFTGKGTNGFDDDNNGVIDDYSEQETQPPYPDPDIPVMATTPQSTFPPAVGLRGVQVKIRCFDPFSKQVREVTIVQDFLPK